MASADLGPHGKFVFYGDSASAESARVCLASFSWRRGFDGIVASASQRGFAWGIRLLRGLWLLGGGD